METQEIVSRVVRVYMAARDETQEELGHALGLSRPAVTQKLSGRSRWTLSDLEGLSSHYGVPVEELIKGPLLEQLGAGKRRRAGPRARRSA